MKIIYAFLCTWLIASNCFSQSTHAIDTSNGRYWNPSFFSAVTVTSNVTYGSAVNINNSTQTLTMDIYQPTGDTVTQRPVLILAHGGSFVGGTKNDQDVTALCTNFAKMGYVCASIDYRLGMGFPIDSVSATKAVIRAVQDMKAAIRFFRQDFFGGNQYKIQPNYIFAGGSSAGAFMGLHLAYLDKISEVPSWINIASLGGLDGNSGNPGYPHRINGVINLCGALGKAYWMETNDIPLVSLHGTNDQTVPYGHAMIYIGSYPIMVVDGSFPIKVQANATGTQNPFYTFNGANHVPYAGTSPAALAYMDTTMNFVKAFLRPLLVQPSNTVITEQKEKISLEIYPNPAEEYFFIHIENSGTIQYKAQLADISGRIVSSSMVSSSLYRYSTAGLPEGIYLLRIENAAGEIITNKIVVR